MTELTLFIDGASRGNPGHAGIGIRIEAGGELLTEHCEYIGCTTNNVAEYRALIKGLEIAAQFKANRVIVFSDSELVVRQMNGTYKVKSGGLLPLYQTARMQSRIFDGFQIKHVRREQNREADRLANQGIATKDSADTSKK
ncbi:MAG: ribonuclease HI family protein [Gemmatimonadota bacterium]|nr:ribonuclease HI family protein [Gemmatimonadota bacterium]MDE2829488.1 ribonuclease HI family protein [Gemmatimonadota bacterium]